MVTFGLIIFIPGQAISKLLKLPVTSPSLQLPEHTLSFYCVHSESLREKDSIVQFLSLSATIISMGQSYRHYKAFISKY